jgi:D-psicose/D-tagatose/L-ribulose 3-epimerase
VRHPPATAGAGRDRGSRPAIGANVWIWDSPITDVVIGELAPRVAGLGFDLIELPVEDPGAWDPGRAAEALARAGLEAGVCCVMPPGRDLAVDDEEVVASTRAYLSHCVEVADRVGSRVVGGPMYAAVGRLWAMDEAQRRRTVARVAERLRPVAELAGERGVRLAVEPLNRYETSLINTVEQGLFLIETIDHPACGLLLDTFHMNIEERSPAAAARAAAGSIAHVHACGTDRGAPGGDAFDWPGFLAALRDAGYDGSLCIESFTSTNEVIATAAAIWRPLAASPDALAADGLRFLRETARLI